MSTPDYDPHDLPGQAATAKAREQQSKLSSQTDIEDTKWLMSTKRGRRMLWRVLDRAGVFRLSFNTNALAMAFAGGCKNEGLRTLDMIQQASPDLYPTMLKEARE